MIVRPSEYLIRECLDGAHIAHIHKVREVVKAYRSWCKLYNLGRSSSAPEQMRQAREGWRSCGLALKEYVKTGDINNALYRYPAWAWKTTAKV